MLKRRKIEHHDSMVSDQHLSANESSSSNDKSPHMASVLQAIHADSTAALVERTSPSSSAGATTTATDAPAKPTIVASIAMKTPLAGSDDSNNNSSITEARMKYLAELRTHVAGLQGLVNTYLTERMEEDNKRRAEAEAEAVQKQPSEGGKQGSSATTAAAAKAKAKAAAIAAAQERARREEENYGEEMVDDD